jgi:hypothetical protein
VKLALGLVKAKRTLASRLSAMLAFAPLQDHAEFGHGDSKLAETE